MWTKVGASIYSLPFLLSIYDWWVLSFSNKYAWGASTDTILQSFFAKHFLAGRSIGRHLDIGVGSGFYPASICEDPLGKSPHLCLMDCNPNSLAKAQSVIEKVHPQWQIETFQHDIFSSLQTKVDPFNSISLFYLLHCLPGKSLFDKEPVFSLAKELLEPDGVLFGCTILGDTAHHNLFGAALMKLYNSTRIFSNKNDTLEDLHMILDKHFVTFNVQVHGKVAVFNAEKPRQLAK